MESVIAALVTGVLTLIGVLVSNSRSRAVMEVKIDNLTRQVEKHNCLIEGIAMDTFLTSNEWQWRLLRTVVQGVLGVIVANIDMLVGCAVLEPTWRAVVVALVMAVLSPVMAELGAASVEKKELSDE